MPQKTGSFALSATSFEIGTVAFWLFCSGPPSPKKYVPIQIAIQLSMIVVITSCAPTYAFSEPAMPAHTAPATIAAPIAIRMCGSVAMPGRLTPTQFAT